MKDKMDADISMEYNGIRFLQLVRKRETTSISNEKKKFRFKIMEEFLDHNFDVINFEELLKVAKSYVPSIREYSIIHLKYIFHLLVKEGFSYSEIQSELVFFFFPPIVMEEALKDLNNCDIGKELHDDSDKKIQLLLYYAIKNYNDMEGLS